MRLKHKSPLSEAQIAKNRRARAILHAAVKAGRIRRQPCEVCGRADGVEGHHLDYDRPLEVKWLCKEHHDNETRGRTIIRRRRAEPLPGDQLAAASAAMLAPDSYGTARVLELDAADRDRQAARRKRARGLVRTALRAGRMHRAPCEICGAPETSAHHIDPRRPLAVRWLCREHRTGVVHGETL